MSRKRIFASGDRSADSGPAWVTQSTYTALTDTTLTAITALSTATGVGGAKDFDAGHAGKLVAGKRYRVVTFVSGDDFANVGGTNTSGTTFTAKATAKTTDGGYSAGQIATPTTWSNASTLAELDVETVIDDLFISADALCAVTIKEETSGNVLVKPNLTANATVQVTLRNGLRVPSPTAIKKVMAVLSTVANCQITCNYHFEPTA